MKSDDRPAPETRSAPVPSAVENRERTRRRRPDAAGAEERVAPRGGGPACPTQMVSSDWALRCYRLGFLELQFILSHVDGDSIALAKLSLEHAHRQRIEHAALNGPFEGSRPVHWIVSL